MTKSMILRGKSLSMVMRTLLFPLFCVTGSLLFTSCEETTEIDEYANWQERNEAFIDSIADVVDHCNDGRWVKILAYNLNDTDIDGNIAIHDNADYVYCYKEQSGTGTEHPLTFVSVDYRGRLMPTANHPSGFVFDESYKGAFNPNTCKPAEFRIDGVVAGWQTVLPHMTKGDRWIVYIPAKLGYGSQTKTNIPAHSALVFDMHLADFATDK